jgi:hypothetical protein
LEIERQNTDSKFRDSSFCLRSCTHASPPWAVRGGGLPLPSQESK